MMKSILPALTEILCHPVTGHSVTYRGTHFQSENGDRFPIIDDVPVFKPDQTTLRHRLWEWVYNRIAFSYDFGVRLAWQLPLGGAPLSRESYLPEINVKPGDRVLEAAVGTGDNLLALPADARYVGIDLSFRMLQRCKRKLEAAGRAAGLIQADMNALPFIQGSFDTVLHVGGLQFMSQPAVGVREMHRVTRPGGEVTVVDETASLPALLRRAAVDRPDQLAPAGSEIIRTDEISDGELFLLKFIRT